MAAGARVPDDMTDTAPQGPGIVRIDFTADDLATARAAAARIATLWESTGGERGQLAEQDTRASLYADITRRPTPRRTLAVRRPHVRMHIANRYRSVI
ncbi:DUF6207 family protein [Streptomyces sp. Edi2]|uniref:DUF6207 family protein n=1 Tax=Streptomyces sp. Edi2 TaxID=3162528 RepID=UPI003305738F